MIFFPFDIADITINVVNVGIDDINTLVCFSDNKIYFNVDIIN